MSLDALIRLRKQHKRPAVVWVVVGAGPQRLHELPDCIEVRANPESMDWRAVYGIHVDVFDLSGDNDLLDRTIGAIEGASPKGVGVACDMDVIGLNDQHEFYLRAIRRHLANSVR